MDRVGVVYIMTSGRNGTLYLGVTSDLVRRVSQHRLGTFDGFTKRYEVKLLVWYRFFDDIRAAIDCETRIKGWKRAWKLRVIHEDNVTWRDLALDLGFEAVK